MVLLVNKARGLTASVLGELSEGFPEVSPVGEELPVSEEAFFLGGVLQTAAAAFGGGDAGLSNCSQYLQPLSKLEALATGTALEGPAGTSETAGAFGGAAFTAARGPAGTSETAGAFDRVTVAAGGPAETAGAFEVTVAAGGPAGTLETAGAFEVGTGEGTAGFTEVYWLGTGGTDFSLRDGFGFSPGLHPPPTIVSLAPGFIPSDRNSPRIRASTNPKKTQKHLTPDGKAPKPIAHQCGTAELQSDGGLPELRV